jgi:hypothetical protein
MAKSKAIAVPKQSIKAIALRPSPAKLMDQALEMFAGQVNLAETPEELAQLHSQVKGWGTVLEDISKVTRSHLLSYIKAKGVIATEAGSLNARAGDWTLEAKVRKSGYDDKKVESFLRAKNIPLEKGMNAEVKYKSSEDKLELLAKSKTISSDELALLKADLEYNVSVKPAKEE